MGFFNSIAGGAGAHDPTIDWSSTSGLPTPAVRLSRREIGSLAFGAPLADARCFGRPDGFRRVHHDYFELVYARAGFQLDFEAERLAYAAFFVGPDASAPGRNLRFCRPLEVDCGPLSGETTQDVLENLFGPPDAVGRDDAETIVKFSKNGLVLEFELNRSGRLKRWNLFPATPHR